MNYFNVCPNSCSQFKNDKSFVFEKSKLKNNFPFRKNYLHTLMFYAQQFNFK